MTTQELREAAERYRDGRYLDFQRDKDEWYAPCRLMDDQQMLANAYLAEHPSDDDEPVTCQWLIQQGWTLRKYGGYESYIYNHWLYGTWYASGAVVFYFNNKDVLAGESTTRGQVRRLIAALKGE